MAVVPLLVNFGALTPHALPASSCTQGPPDLSMDDVASRPCRPPCQFFIPDGLPSRVCVGPEFPSQGLPGRYQHSSPSSHPGGCRHSYCLPACLPACLPCCRLCMNEPACREEDCRLRCIRYCRNRARAWREKGLHAPPPQPDLPHPAHGIQAWTPAASCPGWIAGRACWNWRRPEPWSFQVGSVQVGTWRSSPGCRGRARFQPVLGRELVKRALEAVLPRPPSPAAPARLLL